MLRHSFTRTTTSRQDIVDEFANDNKNASRGCPRHVQMDLNPEIIMMPH